MIPFELAMDLAAAHGTPLMVVSRKQVARNVKTLQKLLPSVDIHYAMKANPHPAVLEEVLRSGATVEVASPQELDIALGIGFRADRILYSNPVRRPSEILYSRERGIDWFIFDSRTELEKLAQYAPGANVLLRLSVSNPDCVVRLSEKFGAPAAGAESLIHEGMARGLRVRGLAFHVGSQTFNPYAYVDVIVECRRLFSLLEARNVHLDVLDIGGGFPVEYLEKVIPIGDFCGPIRHALEAYFPTTRVLSEPGRFISATAVTLVLSVISKCERDGATWYYLDDGLYGAFSGMIYDKCRYRIVSPRKTPLRPCVIAGPTCDSFDVISKEYMLPELEAADILLVSCMGAYTTANVQGFNGIPSARAVVLDEDGRK